MGISLAVLLPVCMGSVAAERHRGGVAKAVSGVPWSARHRCRTPVRCPPQPSGGCPKAGGPLTL